MSEHEQLSIDTVKRDMVRRSLTPSDNDTMRGNLWWANYKAAAELVEHIMAQAVGQPEWVDAFRHVLQDAWSEQMNVQPSERTIYSPAQFLKTLELGRTMLRSIPKEV